MASTEEVKASRSWPQIEAAWKAVDAWTALSKGTRRLYRLGLADFYIWCEDHGITPEPILWQSVVRYVKFHKHRPGTRGRTIAPSTLRYRVAALKRLSRTYRDLYGEKWPVLDSSQALKDAEAEYRSWYYDEKRFRKHQAAPVGIHELPEILAAADEDTIIGRRDRTIVLTAYAMGARESEVSALNVDHVKFIRGNARVTWYASKRNKFGHEEVALIQPNPYNLDICPVRALRDWIDELAEHGICGARPVFGITKSKFNWPREWRRLSPYDVGRAFQRLAERAEMEDVSGHSGRRGMGGDLYTAGKDVLDVKEALRLANTDVAAGYAKGFRQEARQVMGDVYRQAAGE